MVNCKLDLLETWLRCDAEASWSKLVGALQKSKDFFLADKIQKKYFGIKGKAGELLHNCSVEPQPMN